MILHIVPEITQELSRNSPTNVKLMDYKTFNLREVHPFIATTKWESIIITLDKGIRAGYIRQVISLDYPITVKLNNNVNIDFDIMSKLCEAFPDKSRIIRMKHNSGQDIKEYLEQEGVLIG